MPGVRQQAASQVGMRAAAGRALPWVVPVFLLLLWQWASSAGLLPARFLPAPKAVLSAFVTLTASGELWTHVRVSTLRAFLGICRRWRTGSRAGPAHGFSALGRDPPRYDAPDDPQHSPVALIPLVILWFGIDETAKLFLVALGVFFLCISTLSTAFNRSIAVCSKWANATDSRAGDCTGRSFFLEPCLRFLSVCVFRWIYVGNSDRRRDHLSALGHRIHDDECTRVHADGCNGSRNSLVCVARETGNLLARGLERYWLRWHPAYQAVR